MRSILSLVVVVVATPGFALEPKDVVVVANKNVPESRQVAEHYLAKRNVPKENLIELDLPKGEDISRADYEEKLAQPLRTALAPRKEAVKVILTVYGVPLRVGRQLPTAEELAESDKLTPELEAARKKAARLERDKADAKEIDAARKLRDGLQGRTDRLNHTESYACVDSELMCLWWGIYPLDRWVANPLHWRASEKYRNGASLTLMTSRLDGPSAEIAMRLIDDAVAVEAKGLSGGAVIDARGIKFERKGGDLFGSGYGGYDESMRETAALLEANGFKVQLDDKGELLPAGTAKGVALYCGWYSLANFVDGCEFVPGAVAWHLASSEAVTLRDPKSKLWCPNLLKKGVAATLGPVGEPYTIGFPKPAEFFGFLATGEYTLVETYSRTVLNCSWMTVLVGDPLYSPYKATRPVKAGDVQPSPKRMP